MPEGQFASTEKNGRIPQWLWDSPLFEDDTVIRSMQKEFELYKDNFPVWANQSNGMLQFAVWTALELEGLGASLQHYNPLIDDEVKENGIYRKAGV